jgi:hypothetical protein
MLLRSTISQVSAEEMGIDDYSGIVKRLKSRLILREHSQLGQPVLPSLRLGIILQLKAIGVEITAEVTSTIFFFFTTLIDDFHKQPLLIF